MDLRRHFSSPPDGERVARLNDWRAGDGHPIPDDDANDVDGGQDDPSRTSRDSARWARTIDSVSPFNTLIEYLRFEVVFVCFLSQLFLKFFLKGGSKARNARKITSARANQKAEELFE